MQATYEFLRMRRGIRNFKVIFERRRIIHMLDAARYAPTAGNSQRSCIILLSVMQMRLKQLLMQLLTGWKRRLLAGTENKRYFTTVFYVRIVNVVRILLPVMHRSLIFCFGRRLNITGVSNAEQSWAYAELFAPTIGLGTTIAGFIQSCGIAGYKPLLDLLDVPPKHKVVGTLMVGYPKYKYQRMPERQHLKVGIPLSTVMV